MMQNREDNQKLIGPRAKLDNPQITLLDGIIILLAACTLTLFLFFLAEQIAGNAIFVSLPSWIREVAKNLFRVLVGGSASSAVLLIVRRQIYRKEKPPNYVLWICGVSLFFVLLSILLFHSLPKQHLIKNVEYKNWYKFAENGYSDANNVKLRLTGTFLNRNRNNTIFLSQNFSDEDFKTTLNFADISGHYIGQYVANAYIGLEGLCRDTRTGLIQIILHYWAGGASYPGSELIGSYEPGVGIFTVDNFTSGVKSIPSLESWSFTCHTGEAIAPPQSSNIGSLTPCSCNFSALEFLDNEASLLYSNEGDHPDNNMRFFGRSGSKKTFRMKHMPKLDNSTVNDFLSTYAMMSFDAKKTIKVRTLSNGDFSVIRIT